MKLNNSYSSFRKWFLSHLFSNPLLIIVSISGTVVSIVTRGLIPIVIGQAIDDSFINKAGLPANQQIQTLFQYVELLMMLAIISLIIGYITTFASEKFTWTVQRRIREELFDSIQKKPLKYHDKISPGEIMALATNDIGQLGGFLSFGFPMVTQVIVTLLITGGFVIGLLNSIELLIFLLPFLIAYILSVRRYNKQMGPISATFMRKWSGIATAIQDNITGAEVVRAFASEEYEREKFMRYITDFRDTWERRQIIQAKYYPTLVIYAAIGLGFIYSCFLVINGFLSIGELIAFNGLMVNLLPPTYLISFGLMTFNAGLAGAKRIHKAMFKEEGEDLGNGTNNEKITFNKNQPGEIEFKNVTFKYPTSKKPVLKNINLHIAPFQTVAIIGPTGCGKSSLARLLLRLYDYEGTILIDGIDIKKYSLESLRKGIGLIEQDIYLFPRSLKENIAISKRDASFEEIQRAAKEAQIHDWIMSTPKGYDTIVGEGGSTLSGGQKQRIAIARTFLANPRILILDDSTSSIDSRTEEEIIRAIEEVSNMKTTFIITHRLALVRKADVVLVLKDGEIVAKGHHSNLIKTSPDYQRIFKVSNTTNSVVVK